MKLQALGLLYSAVCLTLPTRQPNHQTPSLFGGPDFFICKMGASGTEERSPPRSLPRGCPSRARKRARGQATWEERRRHLWAQRPERQEVGVGRGAVFWWHLFWVFCRAGPSPRFKSCLSDHNRGTVGTGGGAAGRGARESGQTGTYTTDVCSEKYSKIVMQI